MDLSLAIDKDKVEKLEQSATPGFIAPEVFTDYQYDSKVDVYSVGVILFSMLSGSFVFSNEVVNQKNPNVIFDFKEEVWKGITSAAIDLLKQMLCRNPLKRISVKEAMNHPWI